MALISRPLWDPLPAPEGPDPALATDFQDLAAAEMSGVDLGLDQAGLDLGGVASGLTDAETDVDQLALDLAGAADALTALQGEAQADTLESELQAALYQDTELGSVADELGASLT